MEIRNEVKQKDNEVEKKKFVVRNAADIQRAKLEKLMKNPDKPVIIPGPGKNRDFSTAIPSFVRNVMGSSAGAGSGEFHVYRHLRRKEYARQKQIQEKSHAEQLDDAFQQKLEDNRMAAEERTAKKRNKRLKKKASKRNRKKQKPNKAASESSEEDSSGGSDEEQDDETEAAKDVVEAEAKNDDGEQLRSEDAKETAEGKESECSEGNDKTQLADQAAETVAEKPSSENDAQVNPAEEQKTDKEETQEN
uniref:PRKR-interacting protein 1 n=1 Tax=Anopheles dirus TaxID=7168 RepID=A0A182N3Y5_9DIPT